MIDLYASRYERYNGPIGQGGNKTTHTAEVKFETGTGLAVVKAFAFADKGWINEAVAWTLGRYAQLVVPPKAMLLVATQADLAMSIEPELELAHKTLGSDPVVFWCASRLDTKPPQHAFTAKWEVVAMKGTAGRRLAAFDGWIGNCDRIADNAPYWITSGLIAAIDHEKLAFNQDWKTAAPQHADRMGVVDTQFFKRLAEAKIAGTVTKGQANAIKKGIATFSKEHATHLAALKAEIEQQLLANVAATAGSNLVKFLDDRASPIFVSDRLGTI